MTNPIGRFHNIETGEIVDRELTDAEIADLYDVTSKTTTELNDPAGNK